MKKTQFLFTQNLCNACILVFLLASNTTVSLAKNATTSLGSLPKHCHFSAKFDQQKTLTSLPIPLKSSGQIYFSCNAGLIWETQTPIKESLILTKSDYQFRQNNQAEYGKAPEFEVLDSLESRSLSRLLIGLMSSDNAYIDKTFNSKKFGKTELLLTPKDQFISKAIETVKIKRQITSDILSITINHADGTVVNIDTHNVIIFEGSTDHINQCLGLKYPENHCKALFDPKKEASQLKENSGN
jgi:hypothetical protein